MYLNLGIKKVTFTFGNVAIGFSNATNYYSSKLSWEDITMKKLALNVLVLTAIFFSISVLSACAEKKSDVIILSTAQYKNMVYVEKRNGIRAHHEMVSDKGTKMSRAWGSISATCLYDRKGNLTYDALYRTYKGANLLPLAEHSGLATLMNGLKHVGESCKVEWHDVAEFHYLIK